MFKKLMFCLGIFCSWGQHTLMMSKPLISRGALTGEYHSIIARYPRVDVEIDIFIPAFESDNSLFPQSFQFFSPKQIILGSHPIYQLNSSGKYPSIDDYPDFTPPVDPDDVINYDDLNEVDLIYNLISVF